MVDDLFFYIQIIPLPHTTTEYRIIQLLKIKNHHVKIHRSSFGLGKIVKIKNDQKGFALVHLTANDIGFPNVNVILLK